jgi:ferredoxin
MRAGPPDASGRPRPEPVPGSEFVVEADTVIKAIGQKPYRDLFGALGVEMDGNLVRADQDMRTSAPGLFAGGDCTNGGATVVEAVRHGRKAALAIHRALSGSARPARPGKPAPRIEADGATLRHFQQDYRLTTVPMLCKGCNVCVTSCPSGTLALDPAGRISVKDPMTCVFCGLCEARCPDCAIWIQRGPSERAREYAKEGGPVA